MGRVSYDQTAPDRTKFGLVIDLAMVIVIREAARAEHITGGMSEWVRRACDYYMTVEQHERLEELRAMPLDELLRLSQDQ